VRIGRYLLQGVLVCCALLTFVIPVAVLVGRVEKPNGYRFDGPGGASVVVHFEYTVSLRVVGYAPEVDGDISFAVFAAMTLVAIPPGAWYVATRRRPARGRIDAAVGWVCAATPWIWAFGLVAIEPGGVLFCVLPAGVIVAMLYLIKLLDKTLARRKTLPERRFERGLCPACGYDVRATPERCPECGNDVVRPPPRRR
jgi:hypothetical protein